MPNFILIRTRKIVHVKHVDKKCRESVPLGALMLAKAAVSKKANEAEGAKVWDVSLTCRRSWP
jgi:hypothetical protein